MSEADEYRPAGADETIDFYLEEMTSPNPASRRWAVLGLGGLMARREFEGREEDIIAVLIERLANDPAWPVREAAACGLEAVADPRALNALIEALNDPEPIVSDAAKRALQRIGGQVGSDDGL